jgi:hypothetical protein
MTVDDLIISNKKGALQYPRTPPEVVLPILRVLLN